MPLIGALLVTLFVSVLLFGPSHASIDPSYLAVIVIAGIISIIYFYYSTYHDGSEQEEEK